VLILTLFQTGGGRDVSLENVVMEGDRCHIIDLGLAYRLPWKDAADPCPEPPPPPAGKDRVHGESHGRRGHWIGESGESVVLTSE
jgi:hypothetical protein